MNFTKTLAAATALALGLGGAAIAEPLKVGFIYVGSINDGGWNHHHNAARLELQEHFGDDVETFFVENVPEGADSERIMTQMALSGADLIFTTSFGYMEPTINVAAKFPDVKFEHATGYLTSENVSSYSARFYEGRAVMGTIAGHMTETNIIGYIASIPIPEVIRGINATYLHARKVNPDVQIKVIWLYTWLDPAKEADATAALIEQGADFVFAHTDSTAPLTKLEELGGYGFGQAADMIQFAPDPRLSSIIDNWAAYYIQRTQDVMDGTWKSESTWDGISTGMVGIGEFSEVIPADVREEAQAMVDAIVAGEYHPFTGPINNADGSVWLADGEVADDGALAGMNFYVEGVNAELPN